MSRVVGWLAVRLTRVVVGESNLIADCFERQILVIGLLVVPANLALVLAESCLMVETLSSE